MFGKISKNESGFTLIELLISITIIATISSIMFTDIRRGNSTGNVKIAAQKLVSDIRKVQGYAFALRNFNGSSPQGGWGINFDPSTERIVVFADFSDGADLLDVPNHQYDDTVGVEYEFFEELDLGSDIEIGNIQIGGVAINPTIDTVNVIFEPPNPLTYICTNSGGCDNSTSTDVTIEIEQAAGSASKSLFINALGLVDVLN